MRWRRLAAGIGVAVALLSTRATADDRARARDAYDRGAAAHARGDHATAARELALADEILPNPVTLKAAIEEAMEADDGVLAIALCDRARRAPMEEPLATAVRRALARYGGSVGAWSLRRPSAGRPRAGPPPGGSSPRSAPRSSRGA